MGCGATKPQPQYPPTKILVSRDGQIRTIKSAKNVPKELEVENLEPNEAQKTSETDDDSIEVHLKAIGTKLRVPSSVIENVLNNLQQNGIYILETLRDYSDDEWASLQIPTAIQKELKLKLNQKQPNAKADDVNGTTKTRKESSSYVNGNSVSSNLTKTVGFHENGSDAHLPAITSVSSKQYERPPPPNGKLPSLPEKHDLPSSSSLVSNGFARQVNPFHELPPELPSVNPQLAECPSCGRKFLPDRLEKHVMVCNKSGSRRDVFDSKQKRMAEVGSPIQPKKHQANGMSNNTAQRRTEMGLTDEVSFNTVAQQFQEDRDASKEQDYSPKDHFSSTNNSYLDFNSNKREPESAIPEAVMNRVREKSSSLSGAAARILSEPKKPHWANFDSKDNNASLPPFNRTYSRDSLRTPPSARNHDPIFPEASNANSDRPTSGRRQRPAYQPSQLGFSDSPRTSPDGLNSTLSRSNTLAKQMNGGLAEENTVQQPIINQAKSFKNGDKYSGQFNAEGKQHGRGKYFFKNGDTYEGEFRNGCFYGKGIFKRQNGDYYEGEFKNDQFDGYGVYVYRDGERYEGQYDQGTRQGKGTYYYKNGNKYEGHFHNGEMTGEGIYTFSNGDVFEGTFHNGSFVGGVYKYRNGDVYKGQFKGSVPHGLGEMHYANGDVYEGTFSEGRKQGQGKFKHKNGVLFEGYFVNGKKEGKGKQKDEEGVYEGDFKAGQMHGYGIFTFNNGDWYEGQFQNNNFEGQGVMYEKNSKYEGEWRAGIRSGYGVWVTNSGESYEGQFENNTMNGKGSYTWSNGNNYTGYFRDAIPHGRGRFTFADTGEVIEGEFVNGKPPQSTSKRKIDAVHENASKLTGKDRWRQVREKMVPTAYARVHTPFLGQHNDSLF